MRATLSLAGLAVLVVSASAAKPHLVYILIGACACCCLHCTAAPADTLH